MTRNNETRKTARHRKNQRPQSAQRETHRFFRHGIRALLIVLATCASLTALMIISHTLPAHTPTDPTYAVIEATQPYYAGSPSGPDAAVAPLSPVFTPEVQYWDALIKAWAILYQVDPNLIATVIQIESCGDSTVTSSAGAQGLFQVMPFHFTTGEDMLDVQTNAQRGLNYLITGLERADGHVGLALAAYNGGHGIIQRGWATWASETRRYYYWGTRIYSEAVSGMSNSPTLEEWLNAGGSRLCTQAHASQQRLEEEQARLAAPNRQ